MRNTSWISTNFSSKFLNFRSETFLNFSRMTLINSISYSHRTDEIINARQNRPFPSSLVPRFQSESKCETFLMKMTLICMKMKLHAEPIFIWKVSHLDSLWNRGTRELGNGLFCGLLSDWLKLTNESSRIQWKERGLLSRTVAGNRAYDQGACLTPTP